MAKKKQEQVVVDAEVVSEEVSQELPKCEVIVGVGADGGIYFNLRGTDQNLLVVEGLLKYAGKHMDRIWTEKTAQ